MNRILLSALIFAASCGAAFAQDEASSKPAEKKHYKNIGVEFYDQLRQAKTNVVLDVRTRREYEEGHIPGAVLLDFNSPDFGKELAKLDKNKTYLVHCAVGGRSAKAARKMEEMGFQRVFNLLGGMRAWEKAGKPVEKE